MKNPLRVTTAFLGLYAGLIAIQHGIFESLQGSRAPDGLMFNAIGPPCQSEAVWHACFPAMTLIPNLFTTGIKPRLITSHSTPMPGSNWFGSRIQPTISFSMNPGDWSRKF